jgi:hypothetical protein
MVDSENLANIFNQSINIGSSSTLALYPPTNVENVESINEALFVIKEGFVSGNKTSFDTWIGDGVLKILSVVSNSIFETYAFEVPEDLETASAKTVVGELRAAIITIEVVVSCTPHFSPFLYSSIPSVLR